MVEREIGQTSGQAVNPKKIKTNKICDAPVSFIDIYPTMIDLAGLPHKESLDGKSLIELLKDPEMEWNRPVRITYGKGNHAVRSGKWRYIQYRDGSNELYDHQSDPNEWYNLSGDDQFQNIIQKLKQHLPEIEK